MSVNILQGMDGRKVWIEAEIGDERIIGPARYVGKDSEDMYQFYHRNEEGRILEITAKSVDERHRPSRLALKVVDYNVHRPGDPNYDVVDRIFGERQGVFA